MSGGQSLGSQRQREREKVKGKRKRRVSIRPRWETEKTLRRVLGEGPPAKPKEEQVAPSSPFSQGRLFCLLSPRPSSLSQASRGPPGPRACVGDRRRRAYLHEFRLSWIETRHRD